MRRISSLLWGAEPAAGPHPYGAGRVHGDVNLRDLLADLGARPDFTVESPAQHAVDYIHRRTDGEDLYFVTNSADDPVRAECAFRVDGGVRPWFWHPVDGSVTPCTDFRRGADGLVRLAIELPPVGSVFVVFAPGDEDAAGLITARDARDDAGRTSAPGGEEEPGRIPTPDALEWPISGPWTLSFPDGAGAPAAIALDELFSWPDLEPQGARVFSGTARYSTTVVVPASLLAEGRVVVLDLGRVAEVARLHVNGSEVATLWCPPFRADVSSHLQAGPNLVEIEVTNTWHNRIVGDLRYPEAGEFARTNIKNRFRADMELLPSGLLGPVRLLSTTG